MTRLLFFVSVLACVGCPKPTPVPVPPTPADAPVADIFTGQVFDCHGPLVVRERADSLAPVGDCLISSKFPSCLTGLTVSFSVATVACVARDLGAGANAAVLSGTAGGNDATMATNVRKWILAEQLGYK